MFSVSSEPVLLSEAGLHGLCVSLNTPVLNIDELPVGPARAGIVLFDGGYASLELAIGIRSVETRQVLIYTFQGRIGGKKTPAQAMEAAAGFAEGMGFLFDEDVVSSSSDGRARAMRLWLDLTDVPSVAEVLELSELRPRLSPAVPLEQPDEELVLEQLIEFGQPALHAFDDAQAESTEPAAAGPDAAEPAAEEFWLEEASPLALEVEHVATPSPRIVSAMRAAEPAPAPRVSLTKFRQPATPAAPASAAPVAPVTGTEPGGSTLGRVALVRKRLGSKSAPQNPSLLLRLLGSF